MSEPWHLLDTNILLRLGIRTHSDFPQVSAAIEQLQARRTPLAFTFQKMAESWIVATRRVDRNGFGRAPEQADLIAKEFEALLNFLPDSEAAYHKWRSLVSAYAVKGVQVHDARLVAVMRVYGIRHLVTLNPDDFRRYPRITAVHPGDLGASYDDAARNFR